MRLSAAIAMLVVVLDLSARGQAVREVAITFDDLPIAGVLPHDVAESRAITGKLLAAIAAHHVPAIGFVNEMKLGENGETLLRAWLDAGLDLGNHTYSHIDVHRASIADVEADVLRGETVTRHLLRERGRALRFFRHPFLHTGRDLATKERLEAFLREHGYRVAPVTIDNEEYIFAAAYDRAGARGDTGLRARIAAAYVPYMENKFAFFERNERELFGRSIRHVLLLHANPLNADHFDALARMLEDRGYRFIPLERALEDPAYQSPDTYTAPGGITWLHRWAITKGVEKRFFAGEPEAPRFVAEAAQ